MRRAAATSLQQAARPSIIVVPRRPEHSLRPGLGQVKDVQLFAEHLARALEPRARRFRLSHCKHSMVQICRAGEGARRQRRVSLRLQALCRHAWLAVTPKRQANRASGVRLAERLRSLRPHTSPDEHHPRTATREHAPDAIALTSSVLLSTLFLGRRCDPSSWMDQAGSGLSLYSNTIVF